MAALFICSLASLALAATAASPALAADIRVDPGHLQAALDAANPGDRILLDPGTYPESIILGRGGQAGAPITITRATTTTPVLTGPWQVRAPYVTVSRLIFDGSTNPTYPIWVTRGSSGLDGSHFTLENCEVRNARLSGIFIGDTTPPVPLEGVVVRSCYFHDNGTSPSFHHGISIKSGSNHLIEGNLIVRSSGFGIHDYPHAQGVEIRGNEVRSNGAGILIEYDSIEQPPIVNYTIVEGNYLKDNRGMGISLMYFGDVRSVPAGITNTVTGNWAAGNLGGQYGHDGKLGSSDYTRGATWSGNVYGDPPGGVLVPLSAVGPDTPAGNPSAVRGRKTVACSIARGSVRMSRRGVVVLRVTCPAAAKGSLRMQTAHPYRSAKHKLRKLTLGSRSFSFRPGKSKLKLKLTKTGRRIVLRQKRVRARATVTLAGAAGASGSSRMLTIKAPVRGKR